MDGITATFLASRQRECCTASKEFGSRGRKMETIKSWFCPTLHFAVRDDPTNRELSGYSKFNRQQWLVPG
jgi:hypothetical protein